MIKEDEEFLRQMEFEINQLVLSSWPSSSGKIIGGEFHLDKGRVKKKDLADILHTHDSKDSVFNKGGSSDDWIGETLEKPRFLIRNEHGGDAKVFRSSSTKINKVEELVTNPTQDHLLIRGDSLDQTERVSAEHISTEEHEELLSGNATSVAMPVYCP